MSRIITDLHPRLQEKVQVLAEKCKAEGLIIGIGECLRTVSEQDAIYAQGRTTPGKIVTNAKGTTYSSQHQWGIAFDFYRNDGTGAFNEEGQFFERVGAIGKTIGLGWGGDWTSIKDRPHLYLPDWGSTATKLKSSYGTPDKFKSTWAGAAVNPKEETTEQKPAKETENKPSTDKEFVRQLQQLIGAKVDGIPGPETLRKSPTIKNASRGNVVKLYQQKINSLGFSCGTADGIFGTKTKNATMNFQSKQAIGVDGIVGKNTWSKILNLS